MGAVLEQTAAIIAGDVASISYSFDTKIGPRTNVTLVGVTTRLGPSIGSTVTLRMLGGPTGDGKILLASELPTFGKGLHYLVFLTNRDWFASPVVLDLAFRVERVGQRELLVAQDGSTVHGFSDHGILTGSVRVADHAGSELSDPFAAPPFTPPDTTELGLTVSSGALTASLATYKPYPLARTVMNGAFIATPVAPALGWSKLQVTTPNSSEAADAGIEAGK